MKIILAVIASFLVAINATATAQIDYSLIGTSARIMDAEGYPNEGKFTLDLNVKNISTSSLYFGLQVLIGAGNGGLSFHIENPVTKQIGWNGTIGLGIRTPDGSEMDGDYLKLPAGEETVFYLEFYYQPNKAGMYQIDLDTINFNTAPAPADTVVHLNPSSAYKTSALNFPGTEAVPEPSATLLVAFGFLGMIARRRR